MRYPTKKQSFPKKYCFSSGTSNFFGPYYFETYTLKRSLSVYFKLKSLIPIMKLGFAPNFVCLANNIALLNFDCTYNTFYKKLKCILITETAFIYLFVKSSKILQFFSCIFMVIPNTKKYWIIRHFWKFESWFSSKEKVMYIYTANFEVP